MMLQTCMTRYDVRVPVIVIYDVYDVKMTYKIYDIYKTDMAYI